MAKFSFGKIFLFLLACSIFTGCEKESASSQDEINSDHFSCTIDGVPFNTSGHFSCDGLLFSYTPLLEDDEQSGYMVLSGRHCPSSTSVAIRMFGMEPFTGSIDMTNPNYADSCSPFVANWTGANYDVYDDLISGTLNVSTMYPRNKENTDEFGSFKGTFNFKVRLGERGIP